LDADFGDRDEREVPEPELAWKVDPIDGLMRIVSVQAKSRRHAAPKVPTFSNRLRLTKGSDKANEWCSFFAARIACGGREAGTSGSPMVAATASNSRALA
jgi:hypothetical protein